MPAFQASGSDWSDRGNRTILIRHKNTGVGGQVVIFHPSSRERSKFLSFFLLTLLFLPLCAPQNPHGQNPFVHYPGMRKITSAGKTFMQGAGDSFAIAEEKPPMACTFTYDYWIDSTLVTQGEYFRVTGRRPVSDTSACGVGEEYPVYNVSWFDAILFCNAKSRIENLDTVYSYSGAPQTYGGSVYNLANAWPRYDRDGYRLPTESEWEFAAREGTSSLPFSRLADSASAGSYAWYAANASGTTHKVALLSPNAFGLYDMAGNVFEWTGDWKGFYTVPGITNSAGAAQPNGGNERVVKGGSFKTGFSFLRPTRRSAVYETSQSTAAASIGFRCARGAVPLPSYFSKDTLQSATNSAILLPGGAGEFLGTRRARLVFVNVTRDLRTLCAVDFSKGNPVIFEFKDQASVHVPVVSPDGKYAAFSTRGDGAGGAANICVRSLDSVGAACTKIPCDSAFGPRFWVDQASRDTFLLYATSAVDNAFAQWQSSATFMVKLSCGIPAAPPQRLTSEGGFHDGRSNGGRYLVTGYTNLIMRDMMTGEDRKLFLPPHNGKGPAGSTQVCNASICPDPLSGDECLFLDFGCPPPAISSLVGASYGVHEYLFIGNYSGAVLSWYRRPEGESSWDCPEWSTAGKFAVACCRDDQNRSHAIYLVDLRDSLYRKIVEGPELADPYLWVDNEDNLNADSLDLDSLGHYNDPPLDEPLGQFTRRMHDFWRKHDDMRIVFVGTSHTNDAVDPRIFTGMPVCNMAISGSPFTVALRMIENYLLPHCPSLKLVGCDIVLGTLFLPDYYSAWPSAEPNKGYNYDKNHDFWKDGLPRNFETLVRLAPCPDYPSWDTLGVVGIDCESWGGARPDIPDTAWLRWTTDDPGFQKDFNLIKETARSCADKRIHFLMYVTPESPFYRTTESYGFYGPGRETAKAIIGRLTALEDSFPPYVHFYDANVYGYHDYADSEAYDFDHLCKAGARKFSARLDSVVHSILGE